MAFTVKEEYERLKKLQEEKQLSYECDCACGKITEIEYVPWGIDIDEQIILKGYASLDLPTQTRILLVINNKDVKKRYQDRKYKYLKKYHTIKSYE